MPVGAFWRTENSFVPALAVLPFGKKPYSHCQAIGWAPGPVWSRAVNLVPTMGFNPQTLQSVGKHYTYYAGRADKTLKTRYTEHIRYTRSHNQRAAYTVHILNKSWIWSSQKALENFHTQLYKCILKVIKWPIIWEPSLLFEITHNIQLAYACIYKSLHPYVRYSQC